MKRIRKCFSFLVSSWGKVWEITKMMVRSLTIIALVVIFSGVVWISRPENPEQVGKIIFLILGILAMVSIFMGGVYLYSKKKKETKKPSYEDTKKPISGSTKSSTTEDVKKLFGRLAGRDKVGTTLLFCLTLLTLSYAIGGREDWTDALRWWWNSKIFLPSLIAVIGGILFVETKWRKKIDKTLIFTISTLIFLFLVTPGISRWWSGDAEKEKDERTSKSSQEQKVNIVPPSPKEREFTKKVTVLAEYGTFTEVALPPTEKLVNVRWDFPSEYNGRCLAVVVHEAHPEGEVFPCESPIKGLLRATRVGFSSNDQLEAIPVTIKIAYLGTVTQE